MLFHLNGSSSIDRLENVGDYFSHSMAEHPLLQMDELRKLVKRMGEKRRVFYSAGIKPESAIIGDGDTYPGQHPLDYAIDNMENANAYIFIIAPETDEGFKPVHQELKSDIDEFCRRNGHKLTEYKLALFISSPRSVAPHHIDHQHGLIAQIRGSKVLYQWPALNLELTTPEELEIFFVDATRKLALKEQFESLRTPYQLTPGNGVYIPFAAPHTVTNGDEVSVSLSIIFNTPQTHKIRNIYRANYFLRNRWALSPSIPGQSAWKDHLKNQYFKTYDWSVEMSRLPSRAVSKAKQILLGAQ